MKMPVYLLGKSAAIKRATLEMLRLELMLGPNLDEVRIQRYWVAPRPWMITVCMN